MEMLLDLLFDNIFFVIIALGFIMSFLKKLRQGQNQGQGEEQPRKTQGMPPFGQGPVTVSRGRTAPKAEAPPKPIAVAESRPEVIRKPLVAENEGEAEGQWEAGSEYYSTSTARRSGLPQSESPISALDVSKNEITSSVKITPSQAVQGIVWSEIIGPPRAKRSFSSRR
jgi:hypothetical protein